MYQTVIFDLDGTLLNTIADLADAGNQVCRENGWPVFSEAEFQYLVGHGVANLIRQLVPFAVQNEDSRAAALEQFSRYYRACCCDKTRPYPGIPALLERLNRRGVCLAVYSNKPDEFSRILIERFYPGVFRLAQGKLPEVPVKPDPTGLRGILQTLHAAPETSLFVGDSSVDIQTGHNAGLRACGVTWGFRPKASLVEAGADFLCDSAEELEHVILQDSYGEASP